MDNFITIRRRDDTAVPLLAPNQDIYPVSYTHLCSSQPFTATAYSKITHHRHITLLPALQAIFAGKMDDRLKLSLVAVSYTHLDVYKRQTWERRVFVEPAGDKFL